MPANLPPPEQGDPLPKTRDDLIDWAGVAECLGCGRKAVQDARWRAFGPLFLDGKKTFRPILLCRPACLKRARDAGIGCLDMHPSEEAPVMAGWRRDNFLSPMAAAIVHEVRQNGAQSRELVAERIGTTDKDPRFQHAVADAVILNTLDVWLDRRSGKVVVSARDNLPISRRRWRAQP